MDYTVYDLRNDDVKIPANKICSDFMNHLKPVADITEHEGRNYLVVPWATVQEALESVAYKFNSIAEHNDRLKESRDKAQNKIQTIKDCSVVSMETAKFKGFPVYKIQVFRSYDSDNETLQDYKISLQQLRKIYGITEDWYVAFVSYENNLKLQKYLDDEIRTPEEYKITQNGKPYLWEESCIVFSQSFKTDLRNKGIIVTVTSSRPLPLASLFG